MSLKNISLDPFILSQLYTSPIISSNEGEAEEKQEEVSFLGNNGKNVMVLIHNDRNPWLPEDLFALLTNILQACRMNMDDIALVNKATYPEKDFSYFVKELTPQKVILLGGAFDQWIESNVAKNEVSFVEKYQILWSDDLQNLSADKLAKKQFWMGLQELFNLKK